VVHSTRTALLTHGGNNVVLSMREIIGKKTDTDEGVHIPGVLIRIEGDARPDEKKRAAEFEAEAELMLKLGKMGIAPKIYARLLVDGRHGFAMERFQYSLDDVACCPSLMREMFVKHDGESMIVDLFVRASRVVRCIDTKPGNMVVRFGENDVPRLALIDVDDVFCRKSRTFSR